MERLFAENKELLAHFAPIARYEEEKTDPARMRAQLMSALAEAQLDASSFDWTLFDVPLRPEVAELKNIVLDELLDLWRPMAEGEASTVNLVELREVHARIVELLRKLPEESRKKIVATCPHHGVRASYTNVDDARNALDWHCMNRLAENKYGKPYGTCDETLISWAELFEQL